MIINRVLTTEGILEIGETEAYEYESSNETILLLDGYTYEIYYENGLKDLINLKRDDDV